MANINLLPWREEIREERQKQFFTALIAAFIFALIAFYAAYWFQESLITEQQERNAFLQAEIKILDVKIAEIEAIDKEKEKLLARMKVIQELQSSRPKVVKVFDALVRSVPEGIHLDKVTRMGSVLKLDGVAQSNARVSVLMQNLEENEEFNDPKLSVIKRTASNDDTIRNFTLLTTESKVKTEEEGL